MSSSQGAEQKLVGCKSTLCGCGIAGPNHRRSAAVRTPYLERKSDELPQRNFMLLKWQLGRHNRSPDSPNTIEGC